MNIKTIYNKLVLYYYYYYYNVDTKKILKAIDKSLEDLKDKEDISILDIHKNIIKKYIKGR